MLAHSWAEPGDKVSHVHPRAWWEWEQECCVLAGHLEEACDANTAFVLPESPGLHCALVCIHALLYFLCKCCFFPSRTSCGAMYPSFTLALFLVSFLSLSPQIYQVQKVGLACFHSCLHVFPPRYNFRVTGTFRLQKTSKILEIL